LSSEILEPLTLAEKCRSPPVVATVNMGVSHPRIVGGGGVPRGAYICVIYELSHIGRRIWSVGDDDDDVDDVAKLLDQRKLATSNGTYGV